MAEKKPGRIKNEDSPSENQFVSGATFDDLDLEKVKAYLSALDESSDERSDSNASLETRLEALALLTRQTENKEYLPTTTALLLFGKQPQRFLPHSSVKLARFRGKDVDGIIVDRKEVFGTLDKIIEDTARFVSNNMRIQARIDSLYREDLPEYPLIAVREAITNALAHRDYANTGQKVSLRIFDDRLEVESPGGLAGPVTLENLGQKRYSRNPLLARLMYEMRLIEEMGTGIRRMRRALSEIGSPPPDFHNDSSAFVAILPARPFQEVTAPAPPVASPELTRPNPSDNAPLVAVFEITEANRAEYFGLLQGGMNERQARGLLYARQRGRLTNRDYRAVNPEITEETARLDLVNLVEKGFLMKIGDKKGASYIPR